MRTAVVYLVILVGLRLAGKREIGLLRAVGAATALISTAVGWGITPGDCGPPVGRCQALTRRCLLESPGEHGEVLLSDACQKVPGTGAGRKKPP